MTLTQRKFLDETGEVDRLDLLATHIRKNTVEYIAKSKAGHPGGSLSATDLLTAIYFGRAYDPNAGVWERIMRYDPGDPLWANRDRFVLSKGHAAPALYTVLVEAGFYPDEALKIYRKIDSPFQGHPSMYRIFKEDGKTREQGTKGVDFCTGSLGQGLAGLAGMALHAEIYGYDYNCFAILGDGEIQEGLIWESLLTIPNKKLTNVCAFIDRNHLQVDGSVDDINPVEPLEAKLRAFNWEVKGIDGHNFYEIIEVLDYFKRTRKEGDKPLIVIANTTKGKGVPEVENDNRYHSLPFSLEQWERADKALSAKIDMLQRKMASRPQVSVPVKPLDKTTLRENPQELLEIIRRNPGKAYSEPTATRIGYGNALARLGEYRQLFVFNADLGVTCGVGEFMKRHPEDSSDLRERRCFNTGVQEANMMDMAAGMAACGKISIVNSIGVFATGRAWEMIRQSIAYPRLNVKIVGSFAGAAGGEAGVSHQTTEDVGAMRILPNMTIVEPSDGIQADFLFEKVLEYEGPVYFRTFRSPTELIYCEGNPYGVPPLRGFELGKGYWIKEGTDVTLICSGPILSEALKVAQTVKESVGVVDMPTIRPIDASLIEEVARRTGRICTIQDHYENGGLNDEVLRVISAKGLNVRFEYIALSGFARSGTPADLYEAYGLSASRIIQKLGLTPKS